MVFVDWIGLIHLRTLMHHTASFAQHNVIFVLKILVYLNGEQLDLFQLTARWIPLN